MRVISLPFYLLLLSAFLPCRPAEAIGPAFDFDGIPVNANSNLLPQSNAQWTHSLRNGESDQWESRVTGDAFYHYKNGYNDPHMGWGDFGFLEIDDRIAIRGQSLKYTITGAYDEDHLPPNAAGLAVDNKTEYLANTKPYTNAVTGQAYMYLTAKGFYPNRGDIAVPFASAAGSNRLTLYMKTPPGTSVDGGGGYPQTTLDVGPFSVVQNGGASGHFYNQFPIAIDGWTKIQIDNHADWHNGGYRPIGQIPNYTAKIHGFYISTYRSYLTPYSFWFDEFQFEQDSYAPQNEETFYDLSVGFEPSSNSWQIGFQDKYGDNNCRAKSSFELRYSFAPITNENWNSATPAHIQPYGPFGIEGRTDGRFQRVHGCAYRTVWAKFKLASSGDDSRLQNTKHIYFAVKDISQNPANLREINPALNGKMTGQGRNYTLTSVYTQFSVDQNHLPYIKRIDYLLPGATPDLIKPNPPANLRLQ